MSKNQENVAPRGQKGQVVDVFWIAQRTLDALAAITPGKDPANETRLLELLFKVEPSLRRQAKPDSSAPDNLLEQARQELDGGPE